MAVRGRVVREVAESVAQKAAKRAVARAEAELLKVQARETAVAEGKALAGTVRIPGGAAKRELSSEATKVLSQTGRAGVRQREAQAIKEQTIARSGERGWQTAREHFQARMQEGGEFPLRLPQRGTASGPEVGTLGRDIQGNPLKAGYTPGQADYRSALFKREEARRLVDQGVSEERAAIQGARIAEERISDFPVGPATRRVGREQIAARRAMGGTTVRESPSVGPSVRGEARSGRGFEMVREPLRQPREMTSAEIQAGYTGRPRGIRSIETGVSEQTMETARRGILSGAIKAVPVVGGGMLSSRAFGKGKDRS